MSVVLTKHRRKKRGAKNGHRQNLRELLPQELVKKHFRLKKEVCTFGSTNLEETSEGPLHHQVVDIPPIEPQVTEYVWYIYRCKDCGHLIYQSLPDGLKRKHFGPDTLSVVAILTGVINTSKRKVLAMLNEAFSVPTSLLV